MNRVFVFGTLKEGFPNFHVNRGARVPGDFLTVARLPLYLVGERHSPWMLDAPGEGHQVAGQLFDVNDEVLAQMDVLERVDEPDGYRRVLIDVVAREAPAGAAQQAFAYLIPRTLFSPQQARLGPLREYTLEHAALYRRRAAR